MSPDHDEESAEDMINRILRHREPRTWQGRESIYDHISGDDPDPVEEAYHLAGEVAVQNDGITPVDNDDNRIDHDKEYSDYVIADERLRQAFGAIYDSEEISTVGALEELAKTGCQIEISRTSEFESKGPIYKVLTDGIILHTCYDYKDKTGIMSTSGGVRLSKSASSESSFFVSIYLIKHDSEYLYHLSARLELRNIDNDLHGAGEPDKDWLAERDRLRRNR